MKLDKRIDIRLSENDKKKIDLVLNDINKYSNKKHGYRFLIMEFVDNYLNNNDIGLKLQKEQLLKANEQINEQKDKLAQKEQENNIKINAIDNELNNKSIYNISNYKYNENVTHAFNRLKEMVFQEKIKEISKIEPDIIKLEKAFKIKEKGLLKNIVLNHFHEWQNELILTQTPEAETTKEQEIINISEKMINKFNKSGQRITNLNDYLNNETTRTIINGYIRNSKQDINENEIINYMLENE